MASILIDVDYLKERVYRMLRDIESGNYDHIKYGEAAGMLSCAYTKAMDDMLSQLMEEAK